MELTSYYDNTHIHFASAAILLQCERQVIDIVLYRCLVCAFDLIRCLARQLQTTVFILTTLTLITQHTMSQVWH